ARSAIARGPSPGLKSRLASPGSLAASGSPESRAGDSKGNDTPPHGAVLEQFRGKWKPVFRPGFRESNGMEPSRSRERAGNAPSFKTDAERMRSPGRAVRAAGHRSAVPVPPARRVPSDRRV